MSGFQDEVNAWMHRCFGLEISGDKQERNHRFLEEALELVQSLGCTAHEAHQLVDYVFGRPVGEPKQESGGVSVTHAALCNAAGMDMAECGEAELNRVWMNIDKIREKQARKPKHSPLPGAMAAADVLSERRRQVEAEGWTSEHDDKHAEGEMAAAAGCYALNTCAGPSDAYVNAILEEFWPWHEEWWKPTTKRQNLVKAGALILAEIERIDRTLAMASQAEQPTGEQR